jgi:hypothetical protein
VESRPSRGRLARILALAALTAGIVLLLPGAASLVVAAAEAIPGTPFYEPGVGSDFLLVFGGWMIDADLLAGASAVLGAALVAAGIVTLRRGRRDRRDSAS